MPIDPDSTGPGLASRTIGAVSDTTSRTERPDWIARALASAIVGSVVAIILGKLFGAKAGFLGFLVASSAHELADAPLARRLSDLGL
jgi:hypothetical protein